MHPTGVQGVTTVTVGASATASVAPALSNAPFKNLAIIIVPQNSDVNYTVDVYLNGQLSESHTYPIENNVIAHMYYPTMFPANVGTNAIPKYFADGKKDFTGLPVTVQLENLDSATRVFQIYFVFEEFGDNSRFLKPVDQES